VRQRQPLPAGKEDHDAHDTLICISTGKSKFDEARMKYTPELYVKGPEEMWEPLRPAAGVQQRRVGEAGRIEALNNTVRIAARCDVELPIGANHAPVVIVKSPPKTSCPSTRRGVRRRPDGVVHRAARSSRSSRRPTPSLEQRRAQEGSVRQVALRLLCEAGMVWRYGPGIT
jgi:DNA polymerase-3 subunit alpha